MGLYSKLSASDRMKFVILQIVFTISGLLMVAAGIVLKYSFFSYRSFTSYNLFSLSHFAIILGSVVLVVPLLGYFAFTRGLFFKLLYLIPVIVILVFEMIAVVQGFNSATNWFWLPNFQYPDRYGYSNDKILKNTWDKVQIEFNCCGSDSYADWAQHSPQEYSKTLPLSCCEFLNYIPSSNCTEFSEQLRVNGCRQSFGGFLAILSGVTAGILLMSFISQAACSIPILKRLKFNLKCCGCSYSTISYQSYNCNCKSFILVSTGCDAENHLIPKRSKSYQSLPTEPFTHERLVEDKE